MPRSRPRKLSDEGLSAILANVAGSVGTEAQAREKLALLDAQIAITSEGENWAALMTAKGNILLRMPGTNQVQNLEAAIEAYKAALRFRTRQTHPLLWARMQIALGSAYRKRSHGERATNIECAIKCFRHALEIYDRDTHGWRWGLAQASLGNAYFDRVVGVRRENLERSVGYFVSALMTFSREEHAQHWATAHSNLAAVFQELGAQNDEKYISDAIEHFELAIPVFQEGTSKNW